MGFVRSAKSFPRLTVIPATRPRIPIRRRDVRTDVIDPASIMVGGAIVTAGRAWLEGQDARESENALELAPVAVADTGADLVQEVAVGDLPEIAHSYEGVFSAAGTGALSGVVTSKLNGGWWDGTVDAPKAGPALELQAINAEARASLCGVVLKTLQSAFKTYAPAVGQEAEQAQTLFAVVAENATREWLLESRAAAAAAAAAGGLEEDLDEEEDAVDEEMVSRAGNLAAQLVNYYEVELPGSKSALYVNLLTHMAGLSRSQESVFEVEDGEMAEAAIELAAVAKERRDEGMGFSMAAVSVSVLEDAMMRVAEAVASAYLSRVREGASAPAVTTPGTRVLAAAKGKSRKAVQAERAKRSAMLAAAASASKVVRYATSVQPRLKSTRSMEKFRNEVKLNDWVERNYRDVVAMYEDWHSLMGLDASGEIVTRRISICRHSELDQVRGARMLMSMFLEVADIVVPIAKSTLNNVKNFSSWLLVTLIGRSLGLVYRGIKDSMNGNNNGNNNNNAPRFA